MTKEEVLQKCTVEGTVVKLPEGQLDRKLYLEVAKALNLIGGTWKGGRIAGFVFQQDPTEMLEQIANGEKRNLKKEYQFFATPDALADELVWLCDIDPGCEVLEPSAGQGAIIKAINKFCTKIPGGEDITPDCYELMPLNVEMLNRSGLRFNFIGNDFFQHGPKKYDRIIANPPFTNNQDIDHVLEMYDVLEEDGILVSIMSESWMNGSQKKQADFRMWLSDKDHSNMVVPRGSFKESGTMVGARIIVIHK